MSNSCIELQKADIVKKIGHFRKLSSSYRSRNIKVL